MNLALGQFYPTDYKFGIKVWLVAIRNSIKPTLCENYKSLVKDSVKKVAANVNTFEAWSTEIILYDVHYAYRVHLRDSAEVLNRIEQETSSKLRLRRPHKYVFILFSSKPQTFLCVFALHRQGNDQKLLLFSLKTITFENGLQSGKI